MSVSGAPGVRNVCDLLIFTTTLAISVNLLDLAGCRVQGVIRPTGVYYVEGLNDDFEHQRVNLRGVPLSSIAFYLQFPLYWIVFLFTLVCYRNLRKEWCFHCKYGFMML